MSKEYLKTKIGLEIHVQLKTKSKMFCSCDNDAEGKQPNTTVCPVCLGMPGALPVANEQAILWTIKTGLALGCEVPKIAKFDRKHYFYPDLPKGYQISQYDEPFCLRGHLEIDNQKIRLNRIHLEEDAGKLIHSDNKSLVDLNRAGTPLMEIVTEPDITSPKQAGEFLRKLQKIVRDIVEVSEASMEKGHMRCDANISISDDKGNMSEIVELKNINSFRFIEKALAIEEGKLKEKYPDWPKEKEKRTHGYDSKKNITYIQRTKEEAADYRYFPEPDLPPFDTTYFDLQNLKENLGKSEEQYKEKLIDIGVEENTARVLAGNKMSINIFYKILSETQDTNAGFLAKAIVNNYFGIKFEKRDEDFAKEYAKAILALARSEIQKNNFTLIVKEIRNDKKFEDVFSKFSEKSTSFDLEKTIDEILSENRKEVEDYKAGKKQLIGFFMGRVMQASKGSADPQRANRLLREKLEN